MSTDQELKDLGVVRVFETDRPIDVAAHPAEELAELGIHLPGLGIDVERDRLLLADLFPNGLQLIRPDLRVSRNRRHGPLAGHDVLNGTSANWSGAVLATPPGTTFRSVMATWVVPFVRTPFGQIGSFYTSSWVGLDGTTANSPDVLQAGLAQDVLADGTASYYCWYEWFPDPEISIWNLPVAPGEVVSCSLVANTPTQGSMLLTCGGRGVSLTFNARPGIALKGDTAEWVVERPSVLDAIARVASFTPVVFTQAVAFTDVLVALTPAADPVSMIEDRSVVAAPIISPSEAVTVRYVPPPPEVVTAYQPPTGSLTVRTSDGTVTDLGLGMLAGTSPSIAANRAAWAIAFQANTGHLWTRKSDGVSTDTFLRMKAGTSPSIGLLIPDPRAYGWAVAYQAATGDLLIRTPDGQGHDLGLGMMAGTSPAILCAANQWTIAFQANTGSLWTRKSDGVSQDHFLGMKVGTTPSIARTTTGWVIAFQANTGSLWMCTSDGGSQDLGLGMQIGTSPSIAHIPTGWVIAFQADTGDLWVRASDGGVQDLGLPMMPGTSPCVRAVPAGWAIAYQALSGHLTTWTSEGDLHDLNLAMMAGTSASVA